MHELFALVNNQTNCSKHCWNKTLSLHWKPHRYFLQEYCRFYRCVFGWVEDF